MKRSQLALAVAGLLASSSSFALIDGTGETVATPVYFAKGLKSSSTSLPMIPAVGDMLDAKFKLGFGIPQNTEQFIRVDLSDGAVFNKEPECTAGGTIACNKRGVSSLNKSYATFAIKHTSDMAAGQTVTIQFASADKGNGAGIKVTDTSKDITMTFSLHNNDVSADKGLEGSGLLGSSRMPIPYVSFRDVMVANFAGYGAGDPVTSGSVGYSVPLESDVAVDFKQFTISAPVELGRVKYSAVPDTYLNTTDGTNYEIPYKILDASDTTNLLSTGSTLEVSGNFSFLQDLDGTTPTGKYDNAGSKVSLIQAASPFTPCVGTSHGAADKVAGDKITFKLDSNTTAPDKVLSICVTPNTTVPIEEFIATAKFNPVGKYELALNGVTLDKFTEVKQNGTILDTPYLSTNVNYQNRLILTNTSSRDLKYKVLEAVTDNGKIVPLKVAKEGSIPANKNLFLKAEDLIDVAALGVPTRVALRFSIAGSNQAVQGVAQTIKLKNVINGGPGDLQTVPMVRKCGGSGCN